MKSSTAGLEKRKQSSKSMSSKSAPTKTSTASSHEMAPFFSIFYRGISSKINRSSSKIELDGQNEQIGVASRKFVSTSSADKPPMPSALKGAKGNNVADAAIHRRATAPSNARTKSTVELAKEKAIAEGKTWRENAESTGSPVSLIKSIGINSAPTSPQRQRRWPFNIRGSKAQSQEPTPFPVSDSNIPQQQNGFHSNATTSPQPKLDNQQSELPPLPIRRKQGQQEELPQQIDQTQQQQPTPFITPKTSSTTTFTRPPPPPKISFDRLPPPPPIYPLPFDEKPPLSPSNSSLPMSFVQRIKLHKGVRTGKLPVDALKQQTPGFETGRGYNLFDYILINLNK
uniref:WH2 domain-containing protein n=1 Tax=Meloidogyne hapla TaxID=6305 RepID=A0A1I8BGE7_MELHA